MKHGDRRQQWHVPRYRDTADSTSSRSAERTIAESSVSVDESSTFCREPLAVLSGRRRGGSRSWQAPLVLRGRSRRSRETPAHDHESVLRRDVDVVAQRGEHDRGALAQKALARAR
jgi:hypothetical protein